MADLFCNFLDFRSPSTNYYYKLHFLSPPSNPSSSSIARSFNSSFISKIRRKPIFCKPASPAVDVISTHEHHDGSVLFRFGDPSEIVENLELEETASVVDDETGSESVEDSSAVEVLICDDESEVVINKTEIEAKVTELESVEESSVVKDLDVDYESDAVIDKTEIEANGGLTEVTEELESVEEASIVQDLDGDYESNVVVDRIEIEANGYGSTEVIDKVDVDVSVTETIVSVERGDESSDSEGESSDSDDELSVPTSSMEMEVSYIAGPDIENVTSDQEFQEDSSQSNVSVIDEVSEMENAMVTAELAEMKIDQEIILQKDSLELDSGASESSSTDESVSSKLQNVDAELENETIEDVTDNVASSLETDVADASVNSELQNVDVELMNETVEDVTNKGISSLETVVADESVNSELQYVELENETIEDVTDNGASSLETVVADESGNSELQNVDVELESETIEDVTDNGASTLESVVPDESVYSELQSVSVELKNETTEDGADNGASTLETVVVADESVSSELHRVDETIEYSIDDRSSLEALVIRDESVSSELQIVGVELNDVTIENGKETGLMDLPVNLSGEAQNSTDSGFQNVVAETEAEIVKDVKESVSSELLSDSSTMQADVSLLKEAECDNLELPMQSMAAGDEREGKVNYSVAGSLELEEAINLSAGVDLQTSENGSGIPNEIVQEEIESDPMGPTSVSPLLENESRRDEKMDERTVEEFKVDVIGDDGSEGGANDFLATSPESEEAFSPGVDPQTSENGMRITNEILQDEVESYVMESTFVSPMLETESTFHEEMGEKAVEVFEKNEVIGDDGRENEDILLVLESSQEAGSIDYELNEASEDMVLETEGTADDDSVQINQLPEALKDVVTVVGSIESTTNRKEVMTDFVLSSGAALLPHPSKVLTGGEDAYFIAGQAWLGVADGVVQWSLEGIKPGLYAQELTRNCENIASDCTGNSISYPVDLLKSSSAEMHSSGYSTVLIAQFDGQVLHVANVGDSGFMILRHGTVYKRSSSMLHAFHFPMLFAKDSDPSHVSELYEVELEEEDVIITATDGLFDNLYDQEISSIVMKSLAAELDLEDIAALLAKKAQDVGRSTSSRSPFADSAQAAGYAGYIGGKLDDVTVIVSVVKRQSSLQTV